MGLYDGMPDHLAKAAQKNLRAVDRGYDLFNDRARNLSVTTPIQQPAKQPIPNPVAPPSNLSLSIGGPINTSLGEPLPEMTTAASRVSVTNPTPIGVAPTNQNGAAPVTTPGGFQNTSATGAYKTNPAAYGQTLAVRPASNPRALAKFQEQYGWGGGR